MVKELEKNERKYSDIDLIVERKVKNAGTKA